jgi:hypothetical protein
MTMRLPVSSVLLFLLAACGQGSTTGAGQATSTDQWAIDACKTFPASAAAKATGLPIKTATLAGRASSNGTNVSNCSYASDGGNAQFGILLRQDTTGTTTLQQQIDGLTSDPGTSGPSEPVAMPKGNAVWQPEVRTLSWVPDDSRMIVVTPPGIELSRKGADQAKLKASAIAIARAIEG